MLKRISLVCVALLLSHVQSSVDAAEDTPFDTTVKVPASTQPESLAKDSHFANLNAALKELGSEELSECNSAESRNRVEPASYEWFPKNRRTQRRFGNQSNYSSSSNSNRGLPGGRRYYNGRYFGNFNNRYYGPQYGYF